MKNVLSTVFAWTSLQVYPEKLEEETMNSNRGGKTSLVATGVYGSNFSSRSLWGAR